jgi:hypothetical protein
VCARQLRENLLDIPRAVLLVLPCDRDRQLCDGAEAEELGQVQVHPVRLSDPCDDPGRLQRIAARSDEVVLHGDRHRAQHGGDDVEQSRRQAVDVESG